MCYNKGTKKEGRKKMPTCMECGTELELDYSHGTELDGDIAIVYQTGYCPKCGKNYNWVDYYEFVNFSKLKAVE
jgi:uncharacterized protein with PIN domain